MPIPKCLKDWTYDRIEEIVRAGACENELFDFKEMLPDSRDVEAKFRLKKTVAAFANSGGGFLIYGVKDDRTLSVTDRITGIPAAADFLRDFGSFPTACQPSVDWDACEAPIKIPGRASVLHVMEIFSTWRRPHAVIRDEAAYFVKRTNKGDETMSYSEITGAFRESEFRRTGLALLISELDHMRSTAESVIEDSNRSGNRTEAHPDRPWTWATRYSTMLLDTTLGNTYPFLSAEPDLWKLLCTVREQARSSNAMSEAFSGVVFFNTGARIEINDSRTRGIINCAREIVRASKEAVE